MKRYEASVVYAFTSTDGDDKAHGNPALVVFGNPDRDDCLRIAQAAKVELNGEEINFTIIDFVNPVDIENNIYDIQYYMYNGYKVNVCGHGTVGAAKAIVEKYGDLKNNQKIQFNLDQSFEENRISPNLNITGKGNKFIIEFDDVEFQQLSKDNEIYQIMKKNLPTAIDGTFYKTSLRDYICICKDPENLRDVIFPLNEMKKIGEIDPEYRQINVVAPSNIPGYSFEATVFSPSHPAPYYKDPACGSANKEIVKLLKISHTFPERFKSEVEHFKMFYPYRYNETGIMGGIQNIEYYHKTGKIFVIAEVKHSKDIEILIYTDNKVIFKDKIEKEMK